MCFHFLMSCCLVMCFYLSLRLLKWRVFFRPREVRSLFRLLMLQKLKRFKINSEFPNIHVRYRVSKIYWTRWKN